MHINAGNLLATSRGMSEIAGNALHVGGLSKLLVVGFRKCYIFYGYARAHALCTLHSAVSCTTIHTI